MKVLLINISELCIHGQGKASINIKMSQRKSVLWHSLRTCSFHWPQDQLLTSSLCLLFTPVPYFMVYDVIIAQWLCGWNILRVQTQLRDGKHLESKCVGFSSLFPLQASGSSSSISLLRGNLLSQKLAAFKTYGIRNDSNLPRFSL